MVSIYMKTKHFFLCAAMLFAFGNAWAQGPNNSGVYYKDANGLTGKNLKTKLGKTKGIAKTVSSEVICSPNQFCPME